MRRIPAESNGWFDHEDMNSLVRRMAAAGWLEGSNLVNQKEIFIRYSAGGFKKMAAFRDFLKSFPDDFFSVPSARTPAQLFKLVGGVALFAPEFVAPQLSPKEYEAFLALALSFESSQWPPGRSPTS